MLFKANSLKGYILDSLDGEIGKVDEFYFNDRHWAIRYLIANTGNWLTGRQVLTSPYALSTVEQDKKFIAIALTKQQIADSPSLKTDVPVSRQFQEAYYGYYGLPMYLERPIHVELDGVLRGGASLHGDQFLAIIDTANVET